MSSSEGMRMRRESRHLHGNDLDAADGAHNAPSVIVSAFEELSAVIVKPASST